MKFEDLVKWLENKDMRWRFFTATTLGIIAFIGTIPAGSYLLRNGIPLNRLFSQFFSAWVGPSVLFAITTGTILGLFTVIFLAWKNNEPSPFSRWFLRLCALYFAAAFLVIIYQLWRWLGALPIVGLALLNAVIAIGLFQQILRLVKQRENGDMKAAANWTAALGLLLLPLVFAVSFMVTPFGAALLRASQSGGGLQVEITKDGTETPVNAALIFETKDGWYLRIKDSCDKLTFFKTEIMKVRATVQTSEPVCVRESNPPARFPLFD